MSDVADREVEPTDEALRALPLAELTALRDALRDRIDNIQLQLGQPSRIDPATGQRMKSQDYWSWRHRAKTAWKILCRQRTRVSAVIKEMNRLANDEDRRRTKAERADAAQAYHDEHRQYQELRDAANQGAAYHLTLLLRLLAAYRFDGPHERRLRRTLRESAGIVLKGDELADYLAVIPAEPDAADPAPAG